MVHRREAVPSSTPGSDERLMAALAWLLGPLVAFLVWLLQREQSRFAAFQALQALLFDLTTLGVPFVGLAVTLVVEIVGFIAATVAVLLPSLLAIFLKPLFPQEGVIDVAILVAGFIGGLVLTIVVALLTVVGGPLFVLLLAGILLSAIGSIYAAIRVAQGEMVRMPVVARWADQWMR